LALQADQGVTGAGGVDDFQIRCVDTGAGKRQAKGGSQERDGMTCHGKGLSEEFGQLY